jgi:hypothetical protein
MKLIDPNPSNDSPETFVQLLTDPSEWAAARWRATAFLSEPTAAASDPPAIGLAFENFAAGLQIFDGWIKRLGHVDQFEELRVSIIEGPIPDDPAGYTILISSNPFNTVKRKQLDDPKFNPQRFVRSSQLNRMNPVPGSPHLRLFKNHFARVHRYRLFPAHFDRGQLREIALDRYIEKRELNLRQSSDLKPHEVEYASLTGFLAPGEKNIVTIK